MDKSWSCNSTQLLQEIDQKMSRIESMLQNLTGLFLEKEKYEVHQMLLEVSQLLLTLQQDPKMIPLAKGLSLQLQNIQEQCNTLFRGKEIQF
ncbi:hypothetical protein [Bacillus toyonensis]|uniref:hypothetical protein n=1 Tax=Bacillus toyonensis TaxID=155322 RepID=UPI000BFBBFFE|nr:hypothetical protein [Bacillus toyonensis]PHG57738.1 hypothetical protein COI59_29145 [Bacillus toyonensis]